MTPAGAPDGAAAPPAGARGRSDADPPRERSGASIPGSMDALRGFALLLLLQAVGEALAHAFALPVPGPVIGMLLLLPALAWSTGRRWAGTAAELLLAHLSLLFVPVGVGVVTHLTLLSQHGLRLLAVIVLSTWIGLAVTGLVLRALLPRDGRAAERPHG